MSEMLLGFEGSHQTPDAIMAATTTTNGGGGGPESGWKKTQTVDGAEGLKNGRFQWAARWAGWALLGKEKVILWVFRVPY
ncbi:hypothetical protein ZHAS_00018489 [Anopheles sinensis]|uniref:Uncharacterized protein n=1 Tax=Anopheles sinensis TaxID=74873 RepID=A0A084WJR3_ANOSI|nr:hypothetical protein ZHAS_00018489 [Anopheles sinensis]